MYLYLKRCLLYICVCVHIEIYRYRHRYRHKYNNIYIHNMCACFIIIIIIIYIYILYLHIYVYYYILLYRYIFFSICFPRDFWKLLLPIGATSLSKSVVRKARFLVFYASQLSNALAKVSETSKSHAKQTSASSWVLLFGTASRNGAPWDILTIVC